MKSEIKQYKNIKDKVLTTSEVIRDSFVNVIDKLKLEDYVLIENQRQKITMVVQDINTYTTGSKSSSKSFSGKVQSTNENKLLLRTFIKENVYYLMKFESPNITFPNVETIIENSKYYNDEFTLQITTQLMEGFKFMLNLPGNLTFNSFLNINAIVAKNQALEWGVLRTNKIGISGTNYSPPIPTKKHIKSLFEDFNIASNKYKAAGILLVKLIKAQPFFDGNKRTAFLTVNRLLIESALGVLSLPDKHFNEFNVSLNNYYNDENELGQLVSFIVKYCIFNTKTKSLVR